MFLGVGNPENSKAFGQKLDKKIIEFMYRLFGPGSYYRDPDVKIDTNYIQSDMIRENQAIDFTRLHLLFHHHIHLPDKLFYSLHFHHIYKI